MIDLILASGSARRKALLTQLGVVFRVQSADIDETPVANEAPRDYVARMAREKCAKVMMQTSDDVLVLGSDTSVICQGRILGKPRNREDAIATLMSLSGRSHSVLTSVALCSRQKTRCITIESDVLFAALTAQQCADYWETGEPQDKAGSYAIQGIGGRFVKEIQGSYSAIVGLPLAQTADLLAEFNVPIWQFINTRN